MHPLYTELSLEHQKGGSQCLAKEKSKRKELIPNWGGFGTVWESAANVGSFIVHLLDSLDSLIINARVYL